MLRILYKPRQYTRHTWKSASPEKAQMYFSRNLDLDKHSRYPLGGQKATSGRLSVVRKIIERTVIAV